MGKYEYFHFNYDLFYEMSLSFCHSLIDLTEPEQIKVKLAIDEIEQTTNKAEKKESEKNNNQEYENNITPSNLIQ